MGIIVEVSETKNNRFAGLPGATVPPHSGYPNFKGGTMAFSEMVFSERDGQISVLL